MSDTIISTNPAKNYSEIGSVSVTSHHDISTKVFLASQAKLLWREMGVEKRIVFVKNLLDAYKKHAEEIASIITKEIGTPLTECRDEISWDFGYASWFVEHAEEALNPMLVGETTTANHRVYFEPIGVSAVITPWNLPFDMFIWGVIPNLLSGNTVVYKAAEECVLTGVLLEKISKKAGLPDGVLSFVHGGANVGKSLVNEPIDLIWFTGSTSVGQQLFELAGKKGIKTICELGGSNPAIVFEDADIDMAVASILSKRFMFSGQTCDADKRLIVHASIAEAVVSKLTEKIRAFIVGDPLDPKTTMGPLVSKKQLDMLTNQVEEARKQGAKITQGMSLNKKLSGAYYPPTLVTEVTPSMRVWREEVFGPVLPVMTFLIDEEAIRLANDTEFGLGAQVFTKDLKKAMRVASHLQSGNVDINGVGHFQPFNPFGGYKKSGNGREHGIEGFRELSQIKIVSSPKDISK